MKLIPYQPNKTVDDEWDQLVSESWNGTFLHTRRFLSYHRNRFQDRSLLLYNEDDLVAIFPAAIDLQDSSRAVSHPGLTYGGIVHRGRLVGERMIDVFIKILDHYREAGFRSLSYKCIPYPYHKIPSQDDLYALFRQGGKRYRCDLSSAIDLNSEFSPSKRRERSLKKALRTDLKLSKDAESLDRFWTVLEDTLRRKHNASPVHSLAEIRELHGYFPDSILFRFAELNSEIVAGVVIFETKHVWHAQYIASLALGYEVCALDFIFSECIREARDRRLRYFDFGTSNEKEGKILNTDLYKFKSEFGGGGIVYESYEINLELDV